MIRYRSFHLVVLRGILTEAEVLPAPAQAYRLPQLQTLRLAVRANAPCIDTAIVQRSCARQDCITAAVQPSCTWSIDPTTAKTSHFGYAQVRVHTNSNNFVTVFRSAIRS